MANTHRVGHRYPSHWVGCGILRDPFAPFNPPSCVDVPLMALDSARVGGAREPAFLVALRETSDLKNRVRSLEAENFDLRAQLFEQQKKTLDVAYDYGVIREAMERNLKGVKEWLGNVKGGGVAR
ncbi:hypothetical protein BDK51DRAFT_52923 [Blyttiomyces helicus]|uniref:Uncharacterized protein n=1 Tax=Blyttiomyces helicus TaxID=388810 RepID=A0A4P9VYS0_9FUNG|nr:hypothetical protein BDK51DRAFT_52923 [Blyttiomyces helicus]|eukprot:RKO83480.1 hypothetical protein BDK51DRAFT_52923 [Blyttiomyces helicus]